MTIIESKLLSSFSNMESSYKMRFSILKTQTVKCGDYLSFNYGENLTKSHILEHYIKRVRVSMCINPVTTCLITKRINTELFMKEIDPILTVNSIDRGVNCREASKRWHFSLLPIADS